MFLTRGTFPGLSQYPSSCLLLCPGCDLPQFQKPGHICPLWAESPCLVSLVPLACTSLGLPELDPCPYTVIPTVGSLLPVMKPPLCQFCPAAKLSLLLFLEICLCFGFYASFCACLQQGDCLLTETRSFVAWGCHAT